MGGGDRSPRGGGAAGAMSPGRRSLLPLVEQFRRDHQDQRTVFVMMRFANVLLLDELYRVIRGELAALGINAVRGDEKTYTAQVWLNAEVYMQGADGGIAVFDNVLVGGRPPGGINPNVSVEAGYMLGLDKPVLLLRDRNLPEWPSDFAGQEYSRYDGENPATVAPALRRWAHQLPGMLPT